MVDTDVSKYSVGAALLQQQGDGNPNHSATIGFLSKTLSQCEVNYTTTEGELISVV